MSKQSPEEVSLVSVICRSINRPQLKQALISVSRQTYPNIEVILVDAIGEDKINWQDYCPDLELSLISTGTQLTRSAAANTGLESCKGDYIAFLDDDDWIGEDHIQDLVTALKNQQNDTGNCLAAYSNTQKTDADGNLLDEIFRQEFDAALLRRDNYIPIHAMLFHSSLLGLGCKFDDALDIYEDWDFWLQLSRHTDFLHLDRVSAYYRQGGGSETAIEDNRLRYDSQHKIALTRDSIYEKWKGIWSGRELNQLLGSMDETENIAKLNENAADFHQQLIEAHSQLQQTHESLAGMHIERDKIQQELQESLKSIDEKNGLLSEQQNQLEESQRWAEDTHKQLQESQRWAEDLHQRLKHRIQEVEQAKNQISELQNSLRALYNSFSWKAMGPYRRSKRLLNQSVLNPARQKLAKILNQPMPVTQVTAVDKTKSSTLADKNVARDRDLKTSHKEIAQTHLDEFLEGKQPLVFPVEAKPLVSIILVFYNQCALSLLCLESILKNVNCPFQLVIVDNASSDQTTEFLKLVKNAHVIANDDNLGFVKAVNMGAAVSTGEYILLLNNDAILHPGAIENAVECYQNTEKCGAVGGKINLLDGSMQEAGSIIFNDGSCLGYGRGKIPESPEFMFKREVDYCSGAFLLIAREIFKKLDGFDEDYAPAYYEESDFCIRLKKNGLRVVYEPNAVITHYEFASSGGFEGASKLQTAHRKILCAKHKELLQHQLTAKPENILKARTANNFGNVLLIDDRVPHSNLGSGYPRCNEIIKVITERNLNLTLYPLRFPNENWSDTYASIPPTVEVMLDLGTEGLQAFLQSRAGFYDFIIISRVHNMEFFVELLKFQPDIAGDATIIYDAEAVTSPRDVMAKRLQGETVSAEKEASLLAQELSLVKHADLAITVSAYEADLYHDFGFSNTRVIGHSMELDPGANEHKERQDMLFVGALRDEGSPNVDSIWWFVEQVMPLIRKANADIKLHIVGDNTAASLTEMTADGVVFHGRVDDITTLYNSSRLFIAPTRFAAGIPHKVHEAAACGLPCVTTTLLARQLDWTDGKELLAADLASDFAEKCISLYNDSELWNKIQRSSIDAIAKDCSPTQFRREIGSLFTPGHIEQDAE